MWAATLPFRSVMQDLGTTHWDSLSNYSSCLPHRCACFLHKPRSRVQHCPQTMYLKENFGYNLVKQISAAQCPASQTYILQYPNHEKISKQTSVRLSITNSRTMCTKDKLIRLLDVMKGKSKLQRTLDRIDCQKASIPRLCHRFDVPTDPPCPCGQSHIKLTYEQVDGYWICQKCKTYNPIIVLDGPHPFGVMTCNNVKCQRVRDTNAHTTSVLTPIRPDIDRIDFDPESSEQPFGYMCTICALSWRAKVRDVDGIKFLDYPEKKCACGEDPYVIHDVIHSMFKIGRTYEEATEGQRMRHTLLKKAEVVMCKTAECQRRPQASRGEDVWLL